MSFMGRYHIRCVMAGLALFAGITSLNGAARAEALAAGNVLATVQSSPASNIVGSPVKSAPSQQEADFGWSHVADSLRTQLAQDQVALRGVTTGLARTSPAPTGRILERYSFRIHNVRQHITDALAQIQSYEGSINSLLQILGNKEEQGEDPSLTEQRNIARKSSLEIAALLVQVRVCDLQTRQLEETLEKMRSQAQQVALVRHVSSPLSMDFWQQVLRESTSDEAALNEGLTQQEELKLAAGTLVVVVLVSCLGWILRKLVAVMFRSALVRASWGETVSTQKALGLVLAGVVCAALAEGLWQAWQMLFPKGDASILAGYLAQALPVFGFIVGACVSLWRWPGGATQRNSLFLGWALLFYGALHVVEVSGAFGPGAIAVLEGGFALFCAFCLHIICRADRRQRVRGEMNAQQGTAAVKGTDTGTVLLHHMPVYGVSVFLLMVTCIAVAAGYMSFAFLLNGWVLTVIYALGTVLLCMQAWRSLARLVFNMQGRWGRLWSELGLSERRLAQLEVLSAAVVGLGLAMVFIALLQGEDGVSFAGAWFRLKRIFIGGVFYGVPLSPRRIVSGVLLIAGVFYAIRFLRHWLQNRFFPVTSFDKGAQTSVVSILTYTLWIAAGLELLSLIGISVKNLTWVVSALSVGVGFGLQSIVKDFISGLILLAERPVQAGEKITISGNTGVIQRVNVRATDIRLSDGTTLIVPNSQFITANVQNYSAGSNPLKLSMVFAVPSNANLDKVQALFMLAVADQEEILMTPAPQSILGAKIGRTIDVTLAVYIARGSSSDAVRTALLGAILNRFNAEDISLILRDGSWILDA